MTGAGVSRKDRLAKAGVRGKKPISAILRTIHVMLEGKNTTCGRWSNSLRSQPKKNGHLSSSELDHLRTGRGQDNL